MAEFRRQKAALWISKKRETAFNTPYTTNTDFLRARSNEPVILLPVPDKIDDANRAGNPSVFPTIIYNDYWRALAVSLTDDASFDLIGRLALRAVGGSVTTTPVVAGVFKHVANMMPDSAGLQLPSMTLVGEQGGASFLTPGCVIERFRLSKEGVNPAQVQVDFIGSGKHRKPHGIVSLPAAPPVSIQNIKPFLEYNDGALKDIASTCRFVSYSIEIVNNHTPTNDRCTSDPTQVAGDYTVTEGASKAAHLQKLTRGDYAVNAEFVILMDSDLPEWLKMAENTPLTGFTFGARGQILDAGPPVTHQALKVIGPNMRLRDVQERDFNGKSALAYTLQTMHDAVAIGAQVEVINNIAGTDYE